MQTKNPPLRRPFFFMTVGEGSPLPQCSSKQCKCGYTRFPKQAWMKSMDFAYYGSNTPIGSTICTAMGGLRARIAKGAISAKQKNTAGDFIGIARGALY